MVINITEKYSQRSCLPPVNHANFNIHSVYICRPVFGQQLIQLFTLRLFKQLGIHTLQQKAFRNSIC